MSGGRAIVGRSFCVYKFLFLLMEIKFKKKHKLMCAFIPFSRI